MPKTTILVTAATGTVGTPLTHALLRAGHAVHALTRDPSTPRAGALAAAGARLFRIQPQANDHDEAGIAAAAAGCSALYLNSTPSSDPHAERARAAAMMRAAHAAGVQTLVLHGTQGAENIRSWPEWSAWLEGAELLGAHWACKADIEADARAAGFQRVVAVRGSMYMNNFVRADVLVMLFPEMHEQPVGKLRIAIAPDTRVALVDPVDLAQVAALALVQPEDFGDGVNVAGQWLTINEIAAALSCASKTRIEAGNVEVSDGKAPDTDLRMAYGAVLELLSERVDFSTLQKPGLAFTTFDKYLRREAESLISSLASS